MSHFQPYDENSNRQRLASLRARGVDVWGSEQVYIDSDVNLDNIEPGSSIRHATLKGSNLRIGSGTHIGTSGYALIDDCQIGRNVEISAGSYEGSTILDGARIRSFAEFRPGTLVEEQVQIAHSVALKNTVLTATVVTGSLVNYCDIFVSGGISKNQHSEVGSGAVHFNFDPRGDKWSSLVGDARGVLLRSRPIFIGGQCGLVGPVTVAFGAVIAAGSTVRRDIPEAQLESGGTKTRTIEGFDPEIYASLRSKFLTTTRLIGNLWALDAWYRSVRLPSAAPHERPLYEAACGQLRLHIAERVKGLRKVVDKLDHSIAKSSLSGNTRLIACQAEHRLLIEKNHELKNILKNSSADSPAPSVFTKAYETVRASGSHLDAVRAIEGAPAETASLWLNKLANNYVSRVATLLTLP